VDREMLSQQVQELMRDVAALRESARRDDEYT